MSVLVRFTAANERQKQFARALKKNVNDYFKGNNISAKANATMVIKTVVLLLVYIVPFLVLLFVPVSNFAAFLLVVLMGIGIAGVGMGVMHDACHGSYSRDPWINNLLSGVLYLLGSNVLNWKLQHNVLHHTYTNISGQDEDIDDKGPIRLSRSKPLKPYHRLQFLYAFFLYGFMTIVMLTNDFSRLRKYDARGLLAVQKKRLRNEYLKMIFRKIAYLIAIIGLPLYLTEFNIWQILLGFFIMHWVASVILSFIFQLAHVVEGAEQSELNPEIRNDWHVHQLLTTSDFARDSKLLSWYIGGLNFQIEHHLFPGICHVHYPAIAPIVEQTAREYGIPYNLKSSFGSAMLSHIKQLKELGRS